MWCVAIVLVVISGYLLLDFPNVYHGKTSSFCSFRDKNFAADPKIEQSQNTKSRVFATLSPTCYQKTRTKNMGKRKPRNVVLLTKTSQNTGFSCFFTKIPPKHKRHTRAAADARASLLLLLLLSKASRLRRGQASTVRLFLARHGKHCQSLSCSGPKSGGEQELATAIASFQR